MRPAPPEPNTPNTGRSQKYRVLVEPKQVLPARKRDRVVLLNGVFLAGAASALAVEVVLKWLT